MDIEQVRQFCLSLTHVTEDIKWENDLVFSIGEKMFAVTNINEPFAVSFKVAETEFDELCNSLNIIPAPYLARYNWVQVKSPDCLSTLEWKHYLSRSYELVKSKLPKKVLNSLIK